MGAPQQLLVSGLVVIPGNSGILTSGSIFTLPATSGARINVLAIGGGGGGGGGSGRTYASGYYTGGGSGGAGGNAYALNVSVQPGGNIVYTISPGAGGGGARDGIFTSGSSGSNAATYGAVGVGSTNILTVSGGMGGIVSPSGTGGANGTVVTGTQLLTPTYGNNAAADTIGGLGAKGYQINTTVGASLASILTYGSTGTAGPENSGQFPASGTIYGAGGTGGGCSQSDVYNANNIASSSGTTGAVFIWWGY
jgi:hypothetical protein